MKKLFLLGLVLAAMPAMAQDRVAKFDKNDDKVVDLGELRLSCDVSESLFERADKNNDGVLTNSELRSAKGYLFSRCNKTEEA
jgi:Ca2+-binding EF-hand superfamily protein